MIWLVIICVLILVIGLALKSLESKTKQENKGLGGEFGRLKPSLRDSVLTKHELAFFKNLHPLIPPSMALLCKVRMEDVLKVQGVNYQDTAIQRNKIKSRHFDFLLCDLDSMRPLCAIELDDRSHRSKKQQKGDAIKNEACSVAEFSLIRIQQVADVKPVVDLIQEIQKQKTPA